MVGRVDERLNESTSLAGKQMWLEGGGATVAGRRYDWGKNFVVYKDVTFSTCQSMQTLSKANYIIVTSYSLRN